LGDTTDIINAGGPNPGGIQSADDYCTSEAEALVGPGTVAKAMMVDAPETGCGGNPCRQASLAANTGNGQIDWPLLPSITLYNLDGDVAGTTDSNGLINFPMAEDSTGDNVIRSCSSTAPSGDLHYSAILGNWITIANFVCGGNWTSLDSNENGKGYTDGESCKSSDKFISFESKLCNIASSLICVVVAHRAIRIFQFRVEGPYKESYFTSDLSKNYIPTNKCDQCKSSKHGYGNAAYSSKRGYGS